jgi:putative ABC transport system permease protein
VSGPRRILRRLLASFQSRRIDRDLRDEIDAHLAEAEDEYLRRGMSPEAARVAARRGFGGVAQTEEIHREMRTFGWLEDLGKDLRYTGRTLRKNPGFTCIAVLTLGLGIGATTSVFTLLDAVVFKPLPVPEARELVTFYENEPDGKPDPAGGTGRFMRFSYTRYQQLEAALGSDGSIAAVTRSSRLIARLPNETGRHFVLAQFVSGNYFATLRVRAARGRTLTHDDVRLDRPSDVAVVSDGFWRRVLGGSNDALGRTIAVNGVPLTIVGVTPRGFTGLWTDAEADLWLPLTLQQPLRYFNNSSSYGPIDNGKPWLSQPIAWLNVVARIPGGRVRVLLPRLEAANHAGVMELAAMSANPKDRTLMAARTLGFEPLSSGFSGLRARFSDALFVMAGLVALVLIVTCANIANLLLARAAARTHDIRLRVSLGATTGRLVRQCLTESLVLSMLGGMLGVLLSGWGSTALARQVWASASPLPMVFARDARVIAFAALISIGAAILFGLAPALRAIAAGRRAAAGAHQRQAAGRSTIPGMRGIVVGQLALSVVMVSAAVLLGRTLVSFMRTDPGFRTDQLMTVSFDPVSSGYALRDTAALARRLVADAQQVPGVVSAAASTCGLIANCSSSGGFLVEGAGPDSVSLHRNWVSPGYLATVGIPVVQGREFSDRDTASSPRVAIVNEAMVRRCFAGQNPIGKRLGDDKVLDMEIVGVAHDARTQSLHDPAVPMVYVPIEQKRSDQQPAVTNLDVRIAAAPAAVDARLREAFRQAEPNLLVGDVGVMARRLTRDLTRERVVAYLAFGFGALTLLLAALGLYGVLSFGVARRTQEIGVRMALGARRVEVLRLVGGQSTRLAIAGLALGLLATWGAARALSGSIVEAAPLDPATILLVTLAFALVTALASYLPARRATRVDPLVALRAE